GIVNKVPAHCSPSPTAAYDVAPYLSSFPGTVMSLQVFETNDKRGGCSQERHYCRGNAQPFNVPDLVRNNRYDSKNNQDVDIPSGPFEKLRKFVRFASVHGCLSLPKWYQTTCRSRMLASGWVVIPPIGQLARQLRRNQCRRRPGSGLSRIGCPITMYRVAGSGLCHKFCQNYLPVYTASASAGASDR